MTRIRLRRCCVNRRDLGPSFADSAPALLRDRVNVLERGAVDEDETFRPIRVDRNLAERFNAGGDGSAVIEEGDANEGFLLGGIHQDQRVVEGRLDRQIRGGLKWQIEVLRVSLVHDLQIAVRAVWGGCGQRQFINRLIGGGINEENAVRPVRLDRNLSSGFCIHN